MHTIAIAMLTAVSLGLATSAHAQTAGAGPGTMGQMMQGHTAGAGQHGGMAGHQGHTGAPQGTGGPHEHGATGAGAMSGGCPMMSQHDAPAATRK